jgi:sugar phosphate isomerase/epimerase
VVGSDPLQAIDIFGTSLTSGHIKDGYFKGPKKHGEMPIGSGELDYVAIFKRICEHKIHINMYLEHCSTPEEVQNGAGFIKGVLDNLV